MNQDRPFGDQEDRGQQRNNSTEVVTIYLVNTDLDTLKRVKGILRKPAFPKAPNDRIDDPQDPSKKLTPGTRFFDTEDEAKQATIGFPVVAAPRRTLSLASQQDVAHHKLNATPERQMAMLTQKYLWLTLAESRL